MKEANSETRKRPASSSDSEVGKNTTKGRSSGKNQMESSEENLIKDTKKKRVRRQGTKKPSN